MRPERSARTRRGLLPLLAIVATTSGCVVGPEFHPPAPPPVAGYGTDLGAPIPATARVAGGEAQQLVGGADIPAQWWTLFRSPALDALIERALRHSPDIGAARAALEVARETALAQRGAFYPSVNAEMTATRSRTSDDLSPVPNSGASAFTLYTPRVTVAYAPDVFGLARRTVESSRAQADQQRFALIAARITLSGNVVAAALREAALREQIAATREVIDLQANLLTLLRGQQARGYAGGLDVAAQAAQLAQVRATLPPLERQLDQQRHLLAALSGGYPDEELAERFELSKLQLPQALPVSLPSRLVEQRPDVRQAEENLHAASAGIGVAVANRLPSFELTADLGSAALGLGRLFANGSEFWDLGAGVTQPLFRGGALRHQELAARAAFTQASEQYRSTVITAFRDVADTLAALRHDAESLDAASAAAEAASASLELTRRQVRLGEAGTLALLTAERAQRETVIDLIEARAARFADTAALFQALGGGWWNQSTEEIEHIAVAR